MTDFRQTKSDHFQQQLSERGNPHGGRGRRAENNIAEQFETQTGHPLGESRPSEPSGSAAAPGSDAFAADMPHDTDLTHGQHARRGQAQSPRELNLNQPEKKRRRGR